MEMPRTPQEEATRLLNRISRGLKEKGLAHAVEREKLMIRVPLESEPNSQTLAALAKKLRLHWTGAHYAYAVKHVIDRAVSGGSIPISGGQHFFVSMQPAAFKLRGAEKIPHELHVILLPLARPPRRG